MPFAFWNNPLVVSAMRLKYRRGSPGLTCSLYLLVLLGVGALLHYNSPNFQIPFGRAYLLAILSIQFALSGGIGLFAVSASMGAEVVNRTLDFQRIVSLGPREIIVGKMIGEPAICYFLAMATIPLAVLCWFRGGASAAVIVALYLNLLTFTVMAAAVGTIHPLTMPTTRTGKQQNAGAGWIIFMILFFTIPQFLRGGTAMLGNPWFAAGFGLFTPIASLMHLYEGDAWAAMVPLWDVKIPSLLAAPVAQLGVAWWAVGHMSRRLQSNFIPAVTKRRGYAALAVWDLLITGICYHNWRAGDSANTLVYQFAIAHVLATLLLLMFVAPQKEALQSWAWRFAGRQPLWRDLLFGDRCEASFSLVVFALIGAACLLLGFHLPTHVSGRGLNPPASADALVDALGVAALLILAWGVCCQWLVARFGRSGGLLFIVFVLAVNIMPAMAAAFVLEAKIGVDFGIDGRAAANALMSLSPAGYFGTRIAGGMTPRGPQVQAVWLVVAYGALLLVGFASLRRWVNAQRSVVAQKLGQMGVDRS